MTEKSLRLLSLRNIGKMGHSTSAMIPKKKERLRSKLSEEEEDEPLPSISVTNQEFELAEENLYSDIQEVRQCMDLFLNSRIPEAEAILEPKQHSTLYHSLGISFILFLKSMMTFQHTDIQAAINSLKKTVQVADSLRKKNSGWLGNLASWVKGLSIQDLHSMSVLNRHAELVYAESYLLKALLCIIHDESFVSFLREGLHVRSSYSTYKLLQRYLLQAQADALEGREIDSYGLDDHFVSGVTFGFGLFNLMISLLPGTIMKVVEFVGFTCDREMGLQVLEQAGGWETYRGLPITEIPPAQLPDEGLRRQFCDMALLAYHLILSKLVPISDVDDELAARILNYSLDVYPDGIFFLYFSGRQLGSLGELEEAKTQYNRAIESQEDWKQLQHLCYWELGLIHLLLMDYAEALECYTNLQRESNWSKSVYYYLQSISAFMVSTEDSKEIACEMMAKVTSAKQKIAGKSIPLEKFVARKARKFIAQGNRLLFPDLEALNAFGALDFLPKDLLLINLSRLNTAIDTLMNEEKHEEILNYYDDICLCHYLRLLILRLLLEKYSHQEWRTAYTESMEFIMQNADKIQLDHYIYYFTLYEAARMCIIDKEYDQAEQRIERIIKISEKGQFNVGAGPHAKNKYSLENTLLFKCHNCLTEIQGLRK
ncbi:hypothetical protein BDB01DRAFT_726650 [Pilobolus umbonatus]|nr:hypothetical protein BDB01DRAFT_733264 [Pilobolus umbonatus]KAI8978136.1 hypothetical protein BDB01DRAFT_726650 [Pilobolus umbonatus]